MSDALTCLETFCAEEIDLTANDRRSKLSKPIFPSYFGIFTLLPPHSPSDVQPAWSNTQVRRVAHFRPVRGFVAVV
jgi:hypothetical protein